MNNVTMISSLILVGLSDHSPTMNGLFVLFFLIYLLTVITNLLILVLVLIDYHLHKPMYFFLSNLALLDMSYSSVTAPRMLSDLGTKSHLISIPACRAQAFFFLYFACSELLLLSTMSFDRYIAICHPLNYIKIMSRKVCSYLAFLVWVFSFFYSLVHTLCLIRLSFCDLNILQNFFCDLPHLFHITCTDPTINIVLMYVMGGIVTMGAFFFTLIPYIQIFCAILRISSKTGKLKTFSTCTSHLTVVFIFYGSLVFIYFVPTSSNMFSMNKMFTVMYTLINPLLNPLIYSLRNKEFKVAIIRCFNNLGWNPCQKSSVGRMRNNLNF